MYFFQADNFDLNIFMTDYGKGYIKTKRISPDGYIQVSLIKYSIPGPVAQSVTCLAADACLTVDPGVACLILAQSHTLAEIKLISMVILLPSTDSFKKGCCQL